MVYLTKEERSVYTSRESWISGNKQYKFVSSFVALWVTLYVKFIHNCPNNRMIKVVFILTFFCGFVYITSTYLEAKWYNVHGKKIT